MPIEVTCPHCRLQLRAGEQHAGTLAVCPRCAGEVEVPLSSAQAPALSRPGARRQGPASEASIYAAPPGLASGIAEEVARAVETGSLLWLGAERLRALRIAHWGSAARGLRLNQRALLLWVGACALLWLGAERLQALRIAHWGRAARGLRLNQRALLLWVGACALLYLFLALRWLEVVPVDSPRVVEVLVMVVLLTAVSILVVGRFLCCRAPAPSRARAMARCSVAYLLPQWLTLLTWIPFALTLDAHQRWQDLGGCLVCSSLFTFWSELFFFAFLWRLGKQLGQPSLRRRALLVAGLFPLMVPLDIAMAWMIGAPVFLPFVFPLLSFNLFGLARKAIEGQDQRAAPAGPPLPITRL